MLHATPKTVSLCATALLGLAACLPLSATAADDEQVFFCPPTIMAAVGQPRTGTMCDAEHCFKAEAPELSAKQKAFLTSASGQCRYFTVQEVADYWPKEMTQQASKWVKRRIAATKAGTAYRPAPPPSAGAGPGGPVLPAASAATGWTAAAWTRIRWPWHGETGSATGVQSVGVSLQIAKSFQAIWARHLFAHGH